VSAWFTPVTTPWTHRNDNRRDDILPTTAERKVGGGVMSNMAEHDCTVRQLLSVSLISPSWRSLKDSRSAKCWAEGQREW